MCAKFQPIWLGSFSERMRIWDNGGGRREERGERREEGGGTAELFHNDTDSQKFYFLIDFFENFTEDVVFHSLQTSACRFAKQKELKKILN